MPAIIIIGKDGTRHKFDAKNGESLMKNAVNAAIRGIPAECGGEAACATCHVYIEDGPINELPAMKVIEDELLEGVAAERLQGSRLSCQIILTDNLDGLVVRIPPRQV